ncbi:uncharacterized protein [Argopecten irradians]|uniref:uncharacterized protein isoform X2 n=1 Tax=Argopecten irradians TaxID=31199 RepID=UPI00371894D9
MFSFRPSRCRRHWSMLLNFIYESTHQHPTYQGGLLSRSIYFNWTFTEIVFLDTATRKRLSIACVMLTCPDVLLLDEPLIGLTFAETMSLLKLLHIYVQKTDRTLVIATSTCPGVVYQSCSQYLFLYKSKVAFSGTPQELVSFMTDTEICFPAAYNSAEYFLELLCDENLDDSKPIQEKITEAFRNRETTAEPSSCSCRVTSFIEDCREHNGVNKNANSKSTPEVDEAVYLIEDSAGKSAVTELSIIRYQQKWNMPYWREFLVLLDRNFHNARRRILFPIGVIQNLYILIICVLVWWRPERNEDTVKDRLGLFFFTVVQWAFFALLDAILTFPKELKVVNRERSFGRYRLSAYCLSKSLSELPLAIIQPGVYLCVIYWVANLNGLSAFLASLGVLVLNVIAAQSIGLFVGAALQPPFTVSIVSLGLLSMMLLGGAFNTPPQWLRWGKFTSFFYYGLNAFIYIELANAPPIKCLQDSPYHTVPVCSLLQPGTNTTIPEFPSDLLLEPLGVELPLWAYILVLVGIMVVTRLLWYILLRRKKLN